MKDQPTVEHAIRALLRDRDLDYRQVAQRVRRMVPLAHTSSKSVASTVSRLRRRGYRIPDRRYQNHA